MGPSGSGERGERGGGLTRKSVDLPLSGGVGHTVAGSVRPTANHQVADTPIEGRPAIREMFRREFATAEMTCIPEVVHEAGDVAILEWRDPLGLRARGFFTVRDGRIAFQRGYWDKLSFLRLHGLPIPPG
jgi:hypothetical protein